MKKKIIISFSLVFFLALFIFLRTQYVSDTLKGIILPEIEGILSSKASTDKIYINPFPLFIGIDELKVHNEDGQEILHAKKIRGYIGFFELFNKRILIKRLAFKEPVIALQKQKLDEIIASFEKPRSTEREKPVDVTVKSVNIEKGSIFLKDDNHTLSLGGLNSYILTVGKPEIKLSTEKVFFSKKDILNIDGKVSLHLILENNMLDIKSLKIALNNSDVKSSGFFNVKKFSGELDTEINLLVDSLKNMFGLINKGEGSLSIKGTIKAIDLKSDFKNIFLNLRVKGDIYLETLMELLKVKERLHGKLSFKGSVKGQLNDIIGSATAELQKGDLFGVEIDKLNCQVEYSKGKMKFTDGFASLYEGSAAAEAVINLPIVDHFTLNVAAKDVSSKKIFELIKWDPGLPAGKINGEISSSGRVFNPHIKFIYKNTDHGKDIMERVGEIKGFLTMEDDFISLTDLTFSTPKSNLLTAGTVDLKNKKLNFSGSGQTTDLKDITSPYFTAASGAGKFNILLSGKFDNPIIDLNYASGGMSFQTAALNVPDIFNNKVFTYNFIKTTLTYDKNHLILKEFQARNKSEELTAKGSIYFKKAAKLFEIKEPDYDLNITAGNADIGVITQTIKGLPDLKGALDTNFNMKGQPSSLRFYGGFNSKKFSYGDTYLSDTLEGKFSYAKREFLISPASLKRGGSALNFSGKVSLDKKFALYAEAKKIKLTDILSEPLAEKHKSNLSNLLADLYLDNLSIKGEGVFENPKIEIKSSIYARNNRAVQLSRGNLNAKIAQRQADITLLLMDGRLKADGRVGLSDKLPWSATVEIKPANYANMISGFLKDAPDDMMLNLTGNIKASGDADNLNAEIALKRAYLSLFGIGLANNSDILINIKNKNIAIKSFSMQGDDTELSLSGSASIGKNYDLLLDGTSSIAPIKVFFKEIESLKGKAYFVISLSGSWDKPNIDGGIDLTDGTLAIKQTPYRMTSVSAYLYVDDDKVILKNINGKFAGGDISAAGTAYLQGMSIKNFLIEAKLKDLTMSPSKDLWTNLDGNLYYRGSMKSQELTGDINIKKSKYTQRVEWKSWLLDVRKKETPKLNSSRLGQTALNVRVKGDNIIINNNIAETSAKMDMLVRGTISRPVLLGKLNTDKGIVYFRNNEFRVLKARIDFIDPEKTIPYFDIVAETKIKNYHIRLSLDGNFEHFNLSLSSDPILNESDILSLLTVGHLGKQMKGLEGSVGTSEATSFLAGKLQDVLEERVKTITGIDRIQIDPQVSKSTGTVNPRITASKKILGDRLHITYSASTGTDEEQLWKLEYFLDKNISFVGIRDERGGLGGDVKFRFEFK